MQIVNIKRGTGGRKHLIYAELRDDKGELLIGATLDYIVERIKRDYLPAWKEEAA